MSARSYTVFDAETNQYMSGTQVLQGDSPELTVRKQTHQCGLSAGVETLEVSNGDFSFTLVPTRGMAIHHARCQDEAIGWKSPIRGPVHPAFVDVAEPSGLGWLDGFDELLVRCGLESNGAPEHDSETGRLIYPLHGRIGNKPAHNVTVSIDDDEITVTGVVEEIRFHFLKLRMTSIARLRKGERGFRISDTVENLSASDAEIQLLYHINFGGPLLDAGARIVAPVKTLVPRNDHSAAGLSNWDNYEAARTGFEEQVYFFELLADANGDTRTMLKNSAGTRGVALGFNTNQLPAFTLWKNTTAEADGTVTGLEPGTNYPNPRSYEGEQGRVVKIPAGDSTSFDLAFEYLADSEGVDRTEAAIGKLQESAAPAIHETPPDGWCAP